MWPTRSYVASKSAGKRIPTGQSYKRPSELMANQYRLQYVLGEGTFGRVYAARRSDSTEIAYAAKCADVQDDQTIDEHLLREYLYLKYLHPCTGIIAPVDLVARTEQTMLFYLIIRTIWARILHRSSSGHVRQSATIVGNCWWHWRRCTPMALCTVTSNQQTF